MKCKECGEEFTPTRKDQVYCCKEHRYKYNARITNAKKKAGYYTPKLKRAPVIHDDYYTLVKDPLPFSQGGFRKGATFSKTEIDHMLPKRVIFAGTVLEKKGQLFEIRANGRGKLRLEQKGI